MTHPDVIPAPGQPAGASAGPVPALFLAGGERAWWKFAEFFAARVRNPNTRAAYARAARQFSDWCRRRRLGLAQLHPVVVAAYVEELGQRASRPTVKQHLAALRVLFDHLVVGQVLPA